MTQFASNELWSIFDARRVKAMELKGIDLAANGVIGYFKNRRPVLPRLKAQAARIELLEPEVRHLGSTQFQEKVADMRALARVNRLVGPSLDYAMAVIREAAFRAVGMRPFPVQLMGALAMCEGSIAEMATGEGKTLDSRACRVTLGMGRASGSYHYRQRLSRAARRRGNVPDLRDVRAQNRPCGSRNDAAGTHRPLSPRRRLCTSKELVADFLRDQIPLGNLRTSTQTALGLMMSGGDSAKAHGSWPVPRHC